MPKALTEQLANPEVLPQFARPNASSLLNANIRESEMTTTLEDLEAAQARAKSLIDDHNSTVRQVRPAGQGGAARTPRAMTRSVIFARFLLWRRCAVSG
eukprot:6183139-Pleurochrysis_carterae.AAC.5